MQTTIAADGDHYININSRYNNTRTPASVVRIISNIDGATVTVGEDDDSGSISLYDGGDITSAGAKINHGYNVYLMVTVTGITANSVVLSHRES